MTLKSLAKRWLMLSDELQKLDKQLDALTAEYAHRLRGQFGVGPQTAATLLSVAGDNPGRLKNEAALAALCGVNPLPASSGKTVRHRLNRGGSRAANNALWTIAMVRMRSDPRTKAYVARRTSEGRTSKEIRRCLKRYIVRELYPLILSDLSHANAGYWHRSVNAPVERFFSSLKREWTGNRLYRTRFEAIADVREYVAVYYNSRRLHSTLGYTTPMDYEKNLNKVSGISWPLHTYVFL
jgi:transposase InsO family protein